jgi:hypothetical protein
LASAFYFRVRRVFLVSLFVVGFRQFFLGIDPGGSPTFTIYRRCRVGAAACDGAAVVAAGLIAAVA